MREEATVPEATTTCPQCGNQIEIAYETCPHCGAKQPRTGLVSNLQATATALLATTKTHPKQWMIGGGVAAAAVIGAVVYFGGFLGFGDREICMATLTQAKDFGVISPSAELNSSTAKSTDIKNRRSCTAKVGDDVYTMTVDLKSEDAAKKKCTDLKKQGSCVALYSVIRTDGMTTYQVREIPPGETDEALAAESQQQAQQGQVPPPPGAAPGDAGGFETETAVDNGSAPSQPSQAPQQ